MAAAWSRRLALAGGAILLVLSFVTVADALFRSVLGRPIPGTFEASELFLAVLIFFGLPYTCLTDGHVSVDFVTQRFGARGLLFLIVVGGIYGGIATTVESAAFGAVGALVFGLAKRTLGWRELLRALDETIRTTAMVFFIVIGADLFGYFMALSQMPMRLAAWLTDLQVAPFVVLWAIILTYVVLGALMDELAMILLTVPIFFPVVKAVGYDPIWFGVVIVVVVQIGLIAPPVGLNVFVIGGMARDVPLATIYRGILPFLAAMILLLVMLTVWPDMALMLPNRMK